MEERAVKPQQAAERRLAQVQRLFEERLEYRREVTRRGIDDLQYLGCGDLLRESFARLGQEPSILDRDYRLCGEIFRQSDLSFRKRPNFPPIKDQNAQNLIVLG